MRTCYVLNDVPEEELQNVKDSILVDGCTADVEQQDNGLYRVKALCQDDND